MSSSTPADPANFRSYRAIDQMTSDTSGPTVLAVELSNVDYAIRYQRLSRTHRMRAPPHPGRVLPGMLVVRRAGEAEQYEMWMPRHVFDDLYAGSGAS